VCAGLGVLVPPLAVGHGLRRPDLAASRRSSALPNREEDEGARRVNRKKVRVLSEENREL
jgi:hypothetical protein